MYNYFQIVQVSDLNDTKKSEIKYWLDHNLVNYLKENPEDQTEIEHIVDWFMSDKSPDRLMKMSYDTAKEQTDKWVKTLHKKSCGIIETEQDVKVCMKFDNGFRLVKLVGKPAYDREGSLMSHCVSSYFGRKECEIYSLRDSENNPHCTFEISNNGKYIQQIKGKGNGPIHPKYIGGVINSLKYFNIEVRDSELSNLGYIHLEKDYWDLLYKCYEESSIKYMMFNNKKFLYKHSVIVPKGKK